MLPAAEIETAPSTSETPIETEYNNDTSFEVSEKLCYKKKPVYDIVKRLFDIVCSLCALVVLSPVFLITALIIMIDDFGNPFFIQKRVGKNGKVFRMIKFRTMYKNAEEIKHTLMEQNESDGVHFKIKDDPRILKHAKFMRRTSIDELPQLLNILDGSMTIVGPRPFVIPEQEQLPDERLLVKPGLSCYWQLTNTNDMPIEEQISLDYKYINRRSFITDLDIIFKTIKLIFSFGNE